MRPVALIWNVIFAVVCLQSTMADQATGGQLQDDSVYLRSGTVLDQSEQPIVGAKLYAVANLKDGTFKSIEGPVTDSDGRFRFSLRPLIERDRSIIFAWLIHKQGFSAHFEFDRRNNNYPINADANKAKTITLRSQSPFTIEVSSANGEPANIQSAGLKMINLSSNYFPIQEKGEFPLPIEIEGNTLKITWLPSDSRFDVFVKTEQTTQTLSGVIAKGTEKLTASLLPLTKIEGTVKPTEGQSFPKDAKLQIAVYSDQQFGPGLCTASHTQILELSESGQFKANVAVGLANLSVARKGGLTVGSLAAQAKPNETTKLELTLSKILRAKGRVVDEEGKPVFGARVSGGATSDVEGKYETEFTAQLPYITLGKIPSGFITPMDDTRRVDPKAEETVYDLDDFIVQRATPLRGKVIDADGNPVANATVIGGWHYRQARTGTYRGESVVSDSEGNFEFKTTPKSTQIGVVAANKTMASMQQVVAIAAAKPVEVQIEAAGLMSCAFRVLDQKSQPIKGANIELRSIMRPPGASMNMGWGRVGQGGYVTDSEGWFRLPQPLMRSGFYGLRVTAPGYVLLEKGMIENPTRGDLTFDQLVLQSSNSVSGTVVDSQGKPVEGASVWSHGLSQGNDFRPNQGNVSRVAVTTKSDGKFSLLDIHPDAAFVFVKKEGYRHSGMPLVEGADVILNLTSSAEPVAESFSLDEIPGPIQQECVERHLLAMKDAVQSNYGAHQVIDILWRIGDKEGLKALLKTLNGSSRARLLARLGQSQDAMEYCQAMAGPQTRVRALTACAESAEDSEQKLDYLTEAGFELSNVTNTVGRVGSSSAVIDGLLDLGDLRATEAAQKIADGIVPAALKMNLEGRNEFSKAWLAKAIVRLDYESAWGLIKDSRDSTNTTSGGFSRHCGNMAHELAATDPQKAEKLLNEMTMRQKAQYVPRVAYRIAKTDPDAAIRIMEEFKNSKEMQVYYQKEVSNGFSAIAVAVSKHDSARASQLMKVAIDSFQPQQINQHLFGYSLNLLSRARQVDPALAEEAFWKLIDLYSDPNIQGHDPEDRAKSAIRQSAETAFVLSVADRYPDLQEKLVGQLFQHFSGEEVLDRRSSHELDDMSVCFAAMALVAPERTVEWHPEFYKRIPTDARRYLPMPWVVIANALSMNKGDLCKYIANDNLHTWVIGAED